MKNNHNEVYNEMQLNHFVHFSKQVPNGNKIFSKQTKEKNYHTLWPIYKKVADSLGLYFPEDYGYAYSLKRANQIINKISLRHTFTVTANNVTRCDMRYSLQLISEEGFFTPMTQSIQSLINSGQLENVIEIFAKAYFNPQCEEEVAEYISDEFIIVNNSFHNREVTNQMQEEN